MKLVNYQEDLVLHVAEIVLQDRPDVEVSEALLLDTAAYTLNRLPPRYLVSERGFTRLMANHWFEEGDDGNIEGLVEMLLLVNTAVDVVKKRRTSQETQEDETEDGEDIDHVEPHWHNIPYLIGKVVDCESGQPVPDIHVTLLVDGEKAELAGNGWTNPYLTNTATRGFYSFLPKPVHSEETNRSFALSLRFESEGYESVTVDQEVRTHGEISARKEFSNDGFIHLGSTCLKRKA